MTTRRLPSAGFSITIRVSVTADASAIGRLTTAVGEAGAIVTALDVVDSDHVSVVVDLTCDTADSAHADQVTQALEDLDGVDVRKVSDRTFLLHLGGKIEVTPKVALRNRDELSRAYTPGVARVCLAIAENPADARRLTIKRNTVAVVTDGSRRARPGQPRPGRRAAGDGGQGGAVQAVRRGGRLAGRAGHPGHRRDRTDRPGDRPGVRRDQPGGHRRAALLRDRGAAARAAGHPGLPRRPARHRDLRARRAHQRAAGRGQASSRTSGSWSPAPAPPAPRSSSCCCARASATSSRTTGRAPCTAACPTSTPAWQWLAENTNRDGYAGDLPGALARRRRLHRRQRAQPAHRRRHRRDGARTRSCSRWPTPIPRSTRGRPASTPRSSPPAAPTSRTRSTTCWPSPACSAACSTPHAEEFTEEMALAAARAIADAVGEEKINPTRDRAERLRPPGGPGRGRGRACGRQGRTPAEPNRRPTTTSSSSSDGSITVRAEDGDWVPSPPISGVALTDHVRMRHTVAAAADCLADRGMRHADRGLAQPTAPSRSGRRRAVPVVGRGHGRVHRSTIPRATELSGLVATAEGLRGRSTTASSTPSAIRSHLPRRRLRSGHEWLCVSDAGARPRGRHRRAGRHAVGRRHRGQPHQRAAATRPSPCGRCPAQGVARDPPTDLPGWPT